MYVAPVAALHRDRARLPARSRSFDALLQALVAASDFAGSTRGRDRRAARRSSRSLIGTTLTLAGLGLVQAATASAIARSTRARPSSPLRAYRLALGTAPAAARRAGIAVPIVAVLGAARSLLVPVAMWLAVRWALVAHAVELEGRSAFDALRRSGELVRGRWLKVASLVVLGAGIALALGPLVGALLILVHRCAVRGAQHRRRDRLRAHDPVRRADDDVRLLRRGRPRGAGARGEARRAAGRDLLTREEVTPHGGRGAAGTPRG